MLKNNLLVILGLLICLTGFAKTKVQTITDKGAWCWFADPRAIHYENKEGTINSTYIGYIDVHGNIKATQINHLTNTTNEVLIRSYFQPDDHDNPTFLVLPDERIITFYSRHTDEACFYYRVTSVPGDITTFGEEIRLKTNANTTYPSPFLMSDDPDHIYLCWRGIGWHPTIARLTLPDENDQVEFDWGPYQIVRSKKGQGGTRPYAKYTSNGKDKIYLTYTTTHPDNQTVNYIYFNQIDINSKQLEYVKGNRLSIIGESELHDVDATKEYKDSYPAAVVADSPLRNWLWEVALDKDENPVIAMVSISVDKKSHDYFHVRWTGTEWQKTFLSNAGGHFHQTPETENCYSGGMAIDKSDPQIIYGSVPVAGKYGKVYELKKFTVSKDGGVVSTEMITSDSEKNNVRPFDIATPGGKNSLVWMYGDYFDWMVNSKRPLGYPTAIHTNMEIPTPTTDLKAGLLVQKEIGALKSKIKQKIQVKSPESFTMVLSLSLDSFAYHGDIVSFGGLTYGVPSEDNPKPYLKSSGKTYYSTNVLGSSDNWQNAPRSTGGKWYTPQKLTRFQLAIIYDKGEIRTYINGLVDQYIELKGLCFSDITLGGFQGEVADFRVYNRPLAGVELEELKIE